MRRSRLGLHAGSEFPSSGEDSFVAVVVTKLTGALLFLLLLVMVIMALLPKAIDLPANSGANDEPGPPPPPLAIATPEALPEAIAGRPYALALAAQNARGTVRWTLGGTLPAGLTFDAEAGLIQGTPKAGTPEPVMLALSATDGQDRDSRLTHLVVYQPDGPLKTPSRWAPGLPPIPWNDWLNQGFGFLFLVMAHMIGMNTLSGLQQRSEVVLDHDPDRVQKRFILYRWALRLATLAALITLAAWLWMQRSA